MPRGDRIRYDNNRGYALRVQNLPWGDQGFTVRRYRISDKDDFTETEEPSNGSGTFSIQRELNAPGVELIILEAKPRG